MRHVWDRDRVFSDQWLVKRFRSSPHSSALSSPVCLWGSWRKAGFCCDVLALNAAVFTLSGCFSLAQCFYSIWPHHLLLRITEWPEDFCQPSLSNNWLGSAERCWSVFAKSSISPPQTLSLWKPLSSVVSTALKTASVWGPKSSHFNHQRTNVLLNGCLDTRPPPESPSAARSELLDLGMVSITSAVAGRSGA